MCYGGPSGLTLEWSLITRGDARRFASRLPLAAISRAFGAVSVVTVSYFLCLLWLGLGDREGVDAAVDVVILFEVEVEAR